MKNTLKIFLTALLAMILSQSIAQSPQKFNYQAVCRDNIGNIVASQLVTLRFSIRDLTMGGTVLYSESHTVTTNSFGLVNVEVGNGTYISGDFLTIPWGSGQKYLQVELNTGSGFASVGSPQLLSVPYALYANASGNPGPTGPTGDQGIPGVAGPTGVGLTGPTGDQGLPGVMGVTGPTGDQGLPGVMGVTGPTGDQGLPGVVGPTGLTGITGPTGTFSLAGTNGQTLRHDGSNWIANSTLYNDGSFIGINNPSPSNPLDVTGNMNLSLGSKYRIGNYDVLFFDQPNQNFAAGYWAGINNTTGFFNTSIGYFAGFHTTTGYANTFLGFSAGTNLYAGSSNTFIGSGAGTWADTVTANTFIGSISGGNLIKGNANTFLGYGSGALANNAANNVFLGYAAGYNTSTGSNNIYIGTQSGHANQLGSGNIFIGYSAGMTEMGSNKLYISNSATTTPLIHGDFTTGTVTIKDVMVLTPRNTPPPAPTAGTMYFDSTTNILKVWDGTAWRNCW